MPSDFKLNEEQTKSLKESLSKYISNGDGYMAKFASIVIVVERFIDRDLKLRARKDFSGLTITENDERYIREVVGLGNYDTMFSLDNIKVTITLMLLEARTEKWGC